MSHPADDARALILATALSSVAPAPVLIGERFEVPAVVEVAPNTPPPLDLDASVFRYRRVDGRLVSANVPQPVRVAAGRVRRTHGPDCHYPHRRR